MSSWKRLKEFGPWSRARLERDLEREIQNHLAYEAQESGDRRAELCGDEAGGCGDESSGDEADGVLVGFGGF